jgi:lipopolysaccharide/colanic/teichoic acid biosynthesis glycosyltransferase
MQRFFDIIFSTLALLILTPLLIPIIIILKFTGEGEIFFIQQRVGKNGEMFGLIKFATMLKDSPNMGMGTITIKNDSRVLPFGKFLRKTKINELPQLINILKGDMSIIGPRPQDIRCFVVFNKEDQENIKKVRPGLSGIGSIVFRDEETIMDKIADKKNFYDNVISPYKGKLESWYFKHKSIGLYFKLIWLTIYVVIKPDAKINYKKLFDGFPNNPFDMLGSNKNISYTRLSNIL